MGLWIALLVALVACFELWYVAAFFVAYRYMRERMLLLPMAQALLMLLALAYLGAAVFMSWPINLMVVLTPLLAAMGVSFYWRRTPAGLMQFLKSYPRGALDVLAFRRPAADLKRRVRTK